MKKILLVAAVATFGLASCKKDYSCTCSANGLPAVANSADLGKVKKKDAEAACDAREATLKGAYPDVSCKI